MQFSLDLISQRLRPEYEVLRENSKRIRSQSQSAPFIGTWQAGIGHPRRRSCSLSNDDGVTIPTDSENEMLGTASGERDVSGSTCCETIADTTAPEDNKKRREFAEKLLEILASKEFDLYHRRFQVPSDLESVLRALTTRNARDEDLSEDDKKVKQDLEKLLYDVLKSPECEHYKTMVKENSPRFKRVCNEIEARSGEKTRGDSEEAEAETLLVPKGLAKLCQPFCPRLGDERRPEDGVADGSALAKEPTNLMYVLAPFVNLLLLAVPEIYLEIF